MKRIFFLLLLLQIVFISCSESEFNDDFLIPSKIQTRAGGDGKYDLLGYGYDCLYALGDNDKGAFNQIIDIDRYERGEAIDPLTGMVNLKSASNLNGNLNCSKELEHYAS